MNEVDYDAKYSSSENDLLGRIRAVYTGYSNNNEIRYCSSSGGVIREICRSLIQKKSVDGIIALQHVKGMDYEPMIVQHVDEMPNSIYHNVNFSRAIQCLKEKPGRYAIIGLPCQLTSIDLFLSKEENQGIKERCFLKISLVCGYSFERNNLLALAAWYNTAFETITYRNGGRYRSFRFVSTDGSVQEYVAHPADNCRSLLAQNIAFDRFHAQNGCLWCVDHLGYCADIVVGDAWLARFRSDAQGVNIILIRTKLGEEIIQTVKGIDLTPGNLQDIIESQGVYAKGEIGEGMRRWREDSVFVPVHIRSINLKSLPIYSFKIKDRIKIRTLKKLLQYRHYSLVALWYVLLEWPTFAFYILNKSGFREKILKYFPGGRVN